MSRPLRIEFPGAVYHVTSRGDRREPIYRDDEDRTTHLEVIAQAMDRFDAEGILRSGVRSCGQRSGLGPGLAFAFNAKSVKSKSADVEVFGLTIRRFRITVPTPRTHEGSSMATLTVTTRGQVTFRKEVLQHLGIKPGEKIELDLLPDGRGVLKAARPTGSISSFVGLLAGRSKKVATIEEISDAAARGWAGRK